MLIYSIVVTFNAAKWLDKCLGSLVNSSILTKILVIDNKSTDGTTDQIRSKFPSVEIIETGQNLGFGKANNIGLNRALNENADYVFLLNQDAWVEIDTIQKLVSAQDQDYGILSPVHLNGQGNALDFKFAHYLVNSLTADFISDIFFNRVKPLYGMQYVNAAAWLLNMKCIETVGGFDSSFFMYGEDDNYMQRVKYYGFKIGICPEARIYHDRECRDNRTLEKYPGQISQMIDFRDLNKSLFIQSIMFIISQIKAILKSLLLFRMRNTIINLKTMFNVIGSFPEIVASRNQAKHRCAFLLSKRVQPSIVDTGRWFWKWQA